MDETHGRSLEGGTEAKSLSNAAYWLSSPDLLVYFFFIQARPICTRLALPTVGLALLYQLTLVNMRHKYVIIQT